MVWILVWSGSILFVSSLQMALQYNRLIHIGSLSSLCGCGFSYKSGIQQHVVKFPELSVVVAISRNSRQEQNVLFHNIFVLVGLGISCSSVQH